MQLCKGDGKVLQDRRYSDLGSKLDYKMKLTELIPVYLASILSSAARPDFGLATTHVMANTRV